MATDIAAILRNIESCYDFAGKSVLHVGAGGGQFVAFASKARSVLGVDPAADAVERLRTSVREHGLEDRYRVMQGDFRTVSARADVVFFEFCLHEIVDPLTALHHARTLALEVLIADPAPGSAWAWHLCEAEKVLRGWTAAEKFPRALDRTFAGVQRFHDHAELLAKVQALGDCVLRRVRDFEGRREFTIDMPYRIALLAG